jgi:hypothetical protein
VGRQQVLHYRHAERALAVGGLDGGEVQARGALAEAGEPVLMRRDAENPADHRDLPLSAERLRQELARQLAGIAIVSADVAELAVPVDVGVHDDHRDLRRPRLLEHRQNLGDSRGSDGQRRHFLRDLVLENRNLLIDVDLALGGEHRQTHAGVRFRHLFGPGLHALPPLAVERFGDEGDLDGVRFFLAAARCCHRGGDQDQTGSAIHSANYNSRGR